jgi:hypothetical protein
MVSENICGARESTAQPSYSAFVAYLRVPMYGIMPYAQLRNLSAATQYYSIPYECITHDVMGNCR